MIKKKFLRELIAHISLGCVCLFLSGHSYSIVASAMVDICVIIVGFVACALIYPHIHITHKIDPAKIFIICISIGVATSYLLYPGQNMWLDPILLLSKIVLAYAISRIIDFTRYSKFYSNTITILSGIAICIYFLNESGISIPNYTYVGLNDKITYHTIFLCSWFDSSVGRQCIMGPFWESGLYSSMVIYALICEGRFTGEKPRKVSIGILLFGIFLSRSTAGYILAAFALYIIFFKSKKYRVVVDIITFLITVAAFLFSSQIIETLVQWNPTVFWKLTEQSVTAKTRLFSPIACLLVFVRNPITGFGLSYATEQYNFYKTVFNMDALTSTSAFMLAAFGIWGVVYTLFLCRGVWLQRQFGFSTRILLLAIFLMIVNKEPHTSILFTYIMMFYLNKETNERGTTIINE